MKELENIISELVSINRRLANNFKTEEGKELRADLFDITQKLEHYKQDQALQLQQTGVSGSLSLETIVNYVTKKDLSVHKKVCNLWLKSGNKAGDFPKLPPCWFDVEITLKNGKKYKSMLASINNWGGVQFVINQTFKKRIYLDTDEVVSWEFV